MMASHDNDGDEIEHLASPFSLLNSPYKRLRMSPDEDADGDIMMTDGDELEVDEAQDAGSQSGLLSKISTAASSYMPSAVVDTFRKFFTSARIKNQPDVHIKDPACSPPDVKEPLHSKSEVQQIKASILAASYSDSEPTPISLRAHASLHPTTPNQPLDDPQDSGGDDIPLGTLKSLLAARQHLEDARDELIANQASKWIDVPQSSVGSNVGDGAEGEKRTLEPREDPKMVLMEALYPGEGKRFFDWIDDLKRGVGEKGKGRPWRMQRRGASMLGDWKL